MPVLSANQLRNLGSDIFMALGASKEEAELVSSLLVEANLTGFDSHGVIRLPWYVKGITPTGSIISSSVYSFKKK